jgi:CRISPR/Cas system CSM-associated protein Csm3 (group 7 of RAMP superfamily)
MHKATFLEGTICLTIEPDGPVLIKAGESGGADPTRPDMEFVRTQRNGVKQIYLPGPSLKGVLRAQAERICRTLDSDERQQQQLQQLKELDQQQNTNALQHKIPLTDNPLGSGKAYQGLDDMDYSSGRYVESIREDIKEDPQRTAILYRRSSFVSQLFGHTSLAGRVRFADAYARNPTEVRTAVNEEPAPDETDNEKPAPIRLDERNGVAIDRIYGSVAVGPFNYETLVGGTFTTRIDVKNVTLAHLALLGLALRDLQEQRIALGFGKSRGLGRVKVTFDRMELHYPLCELKDGNLYQINGRKIASTTDLIGVGKFCADERYQTYHLPTNDTVPLPKDSGLTYINDEENLRVVLKAANDDQVKTIWKTCMTAWKKVIKL